MGAMRLAAVATAEMWRRQVAMLAVLAAALLRITGARLPGLPRSVGGWAAAVGFHGGLTSVLGLYLVFWVDLTILQAPPHAAPPLDVLHTCMLVPAQKHDVGCVSQFHAVDRPLCAFCLVVVRHVTTESANPC